MKIDFNKEKIGKFEAKLSEQNPINDEEMTISFVALSEQNKHLRHSIFGEPYFLSVDTKAVKFEAKTFYLDHDVSFENAIGKIENVKFENGAFKVVVKFDKDIEASREAFARYKAGFSDSVSVGFGDYKLKELEMSEQTPHYQIYEGVINELSAVWQGADPNAKVSKFKAQNQEPKPQPQKEAKEEGKSELEKPQAKQEPKRQEREDEKEIIALAEITGHFSEALNAIKQGISYAQFSRDIAEKQKRQSTIKDIKMTKPKREDDNFSLARVILSAGNANIDLGYEIENHYNSQNGRFILPSNFSARFSDAVTNTTAGAGAIATDFRDDLLIEDIKKESPLLSECSWLTGLSARVEIPRNNSNITADFVEEGQSREAEKLSFDKIILEPHTLIATVRITRTMLNMSAFSLEKIAYNAMKFAIRKKLEEAILYGRGVIKGIFEVSGIPSISGYLTAPTLEKTLSFADMLEDNAGNIENAKFVLKNSDVSKLKSIPRSTMSEKMLIEEAMNLQGYPYFTTQLIKQGDLAFGDFKDIFIGSFGNIELLTHNERGGDIVLELFLDTDAKLAREKSFVISRTSA